jgi:hypothetical protein
MDSKEMKNAVLLSLFLTLSTFTLRCQFEEFSLAEATEKIMELDGDYDASQLPELLSELREFPVLINNGDADEIARLFFLTEFQVMVLADHIARNGPVVSIYEIALLPAFDRGTAMLMAPCISLQISDTRGIHGVGHTTSTITVSARLNSSEQESDGIRSLLKVRHQSSRIGYGLTAENDPGEPFTFRKTAGADFISAYLKYNGKGPLNCLIAGDYALRFGEGLVFNSSSWQGSWLSSPSFIRGRNSITQFSSTEENNFFRGIGLFLGSYDAGAVLFASCNMIDARPVYDDDSTISAVSNLVKGGIHVSESQYLTRNSLTETISGFHLMAGTDKVRGGLTAAVTWFSLPFMPDTSKAEAISVFKGDRLVNLAADFLAGTGRLLFFSEAAMSFPGSWALTTGLRARPTERVTWNLLARYFSPDYHAFHSGAFSAGSGPGNEAGTAASLSLEATRHLFITAAADYYRIPSPRYRSSFPSYGNRIELRGEYTPRDEISVRLAFTSSTREYDVASETGTAGSEIRGRRQLAFVFRFVPSETIRLTTRASASYVAPEEEKGYLLCQDISYSFRPLPLRLWFRYALCTTEGYDSRLYAWEDDLLSTFSVPAFYGDCSRTFLMLSWKPSSRLEIRAKYVVTVNRTDLSYKAVQEVKGQLRVGF